MRIRLRVRIFHSGQAPEIVDAISNENFLQMPGTKIRHQAF
jgi:hypothetical protein